MLRNRTRTDRYWSAFPHNSRLLCGVTMCWVALVIGACPSGWNQSALAQEMTPAATPADTADTSHSDTSLNPAASPGEPTLTRDQRLKRLMAGVSAVGGILILGVLLIVFALVSSRRLRRLARTARQPASRLEEFWYLKHPLPVPSQPPTESSPSASPDAPPSSPPSGGSLTDSPPAV